MQVKIGPPSKPIGMPTITLRRGAVGATRSLERMLVRRGVDDSLASRHLCVDCKRTPLTGELIHFFAGERGEELVCDLCHDRRDGRPVRRELMHPPGQDRSVRVYRAAV